ncbi:NADPH-dependent FMN reductase [Cellulomonas sp. Leaf334]|uniref:NADPH-dependent FMN reductase n=1 Tax=Cellulomonas sp. Leaf334 TaxID=1736339 RepID=UPI0006FE675D|nr:NAD(P)H-dependent oxidoreductase [Cellulomonas sp. Leaf334]KQR17345.1 NADPH-dependent FMN reductase [Cellulomonas sp. Leaf334]
MHTDLTLALIIGSVRAERFAPVVAGWARERIEAHGGFDLDVIDLADLSIPASLDGSGDTELLRRRVGAADAFVVVTPEYNHGYPGYLKTAIDSVLAEWEAKPVGFVSYGGLAGGCRSVQQLRTVFAELQVVTLREQIVFAGVWDRFDEDGRLVDPERHEGAAKSMLDQLVWWGRALRTARQEKPAA